LSLSRFATEVFVYWLVLGVVLYAVAARVLWAGHGSLRRALFWPAVGVVKLWRRVTRGKWHGVE
jgi:hypothetical protein